MAKRSYTYEERQSVLSTIQAAEEDPELSRLTKRRIRHIAAGSRHPPSERTIFNWEHEAITKEDYQVRLSKRGRKSKLSADERHLLVGYACFRRMSLMPVSHHDLEDFTSSHLSETPSQPTLSRIMKEYGFSSQRSLTRESRMTSTLVVDDAMDFLETVRSYNFPPDRILCMDETGLWSNVVEPRTYHFKNGYAVSDSSLSTDFPFLLPHSTSPFFDHRTIPILFMPSLLILQG